MLDRTGSIDAKDRATEGQAVKSFLSFMGGAIDPPDVSIGAFGANTNGGLEAFIVHPLTDSETPAPEGDDDAASDGDLYAAVDTATGTGRRYVHRSTL